MRTDKLTSNTGWFETKRHERGRRALERQLDYQRRKAAGYIESQDELVRSNFLRSQMLRRRLEACRPLELTDKVLEVGSGPHGLVFGFGQKFGVGVDPLAVEYKSLFPKLQTNAFTVAAIGEELPFEGGSFEIVLSDNVIDHAERPMAIVDELVRVLKPGGLLYFTVNIHHPIYGLASRAHGAWNALGLKFELSPFADHTVHFTEKWIAGAFRNLPVKILSQASTAAETRKEQRRSRSFDPDSLLKKMFFKNAVFEVVAVKE
jgi:SAM-dependent methyltransferase